MLNKDFSISNEKSYNIKQIQIDKNDFLQEDMSFALYEYESVNSTLDTAFELNKEKELEDWSSVLSYEQKKGRGQLAHHWHSQFGNMYATLILPKNSFFDTLAIAPLLGGMLVHSLNSIFEKIEKKVDFSFCMKWTNDLLIECENKYYKIGGILVEEKAERIYAGIGINIFNNPTLTHEEEKKALFPSSLSNFLEFNIDFNDENAIKSLINDTWEKLVNLCFLCYLHKSLKERNLCHDNANYGSDNSQALLIHIERLKAQKELLFQAHTHLAFKKQKVSISEALVFGDFDYYADNTKIFDYSGILRGISLENESLGAIIIDTEYGIRTFLSGSIRLM